MRRFTSRISILCGFAFMAIFGAGAANATTYAFTEGGFTDGATLSGYFTGTDLDGDGAIENTNNAGQDELTGFSATFSGNSIVAPFTLSRSDLEIFIYDYSDPGSLEFLAQGAQKSGVQTNGPCDGMDACSYVQDAAGDIDRTTRAPVVPAVPEPATWIVMLLGMGLVGGLLRTAQAGKRRVIPNLVARTA